VERHRELCTFVEEIVLIGTRALPSRWVFAIKRHPHGVIDKFKVRFVIQGFRQKKGVDFNEIFSPTVRMDQIRLCITHCCCHCCEVGCGRCCCSSCSSCCCCACRRCVCYS
jgi:hypothetical protein